MVNNPESETKYDTLIGEVLRLIFRHRPSSAPAFRAEVQDDLTELIDNYLLSLTQEELNNLANGQMPYEGEPKQSPPSPFQRVLDQAVFLPPTTATCALCKGDQEVRLVTLTLTDKIYLCASCRKTGRVAWSL